MTETNATVTSMPSLFVSHGSPMLAIDGSAAHDFLSTLRGELPRPRAIVVASAHWETDIPTVSRVAQPETIHDFGRGFPRELFDISYTAPGAPDLADAIQEAMRKAGIATDIHMTRGLDHGAWVPLSLAYPEADIPVVSLSIQPHATPEHHHAMGVALAPLREAGVLIVGSGAVTHDLETFFRTGFARDETPPPFVDAFSDWVADAIADDRRDDLMDYVARAPEARRNHPTAEHFLPLFVALGAAKAGQAGRRIHHSHAYGVLAMDVYRFD